ncbi:acyl-CoA dehydrogenase [Xylariaceae sp. FL1651]|nr:acyl-CoA dehydrogenase [Xylariaceae sp. FL1651]
MIGFDLAPQQCAVRNAVRAFAQNYLVKARSLYEPETPHAEWRDRFLSTRPIYEAAVQGGLIKAQIPVALGGTGGELIDATLVVEEMYAHETSASLTILGTGLGLTPLILTGTPELQTRFLRPFLRGSDDTGAAPLASLVFSEPQGSANYAEIGGPGLCTVAREDGDNFIISGEKIWATNCSGWDDRGADLQCVACRVEEPDRDVRSQVAIIIVTRDDIAANDDPAFQVLSHPKTVGHTAVNGPHIRFSNLRVPRSNLLASPGKGADILDMTFTASAALVGAMGVGIMRQTFDKALAWVKAEKRGGTETMLQKQSAADLLIRIKTRCEASRALTWRAACALGKTQFGGELCYEAKIFCSESAVESVTDAINLVGVSAYSRDYEFGNLLQDAIVLPIFDGGNVGVRRRQIERIFADPEYNPWESTFGKETVQ